MSDFQYEWQTEWYCPETKETMSHGDMEFLWGKIITHHPEGDNLYITEWLAQGRYTKLIKK